MTHSERALFNLNARVEARGTIVPKAVGRGYYGPERRHNPFKFLLFKRLCSITAWLLR